MKRLLHLVACRSRILKTKQTPRNPLSTLRGKQTAREAEKKNRAAAMPVCLV